MGVLKNTFKRPYRFISDTGFIMLKLKNISIALLFSTVFVNSKTVRSVGKKECLYACNEYGPMLYGLCEDGELRENYASNFKMHINLECGAINFKKVMTLSKKRWNLMSWRITRKK